MTNYITYLGILVCLFMACEPVPPSSPQEEKDFVSVDFTTADSTQIFGELYHLDQAAPTILLFHQGRSNARGEYRNIAPRLHGMGYNILAIDQRRGGQLYGSYNRVVAKIELNTFGYCDTYQDLEAAQRYMQEQGYQGKFALWGSSYSAALVVRLAQQHPDQVAGVLAFSPASGDPMDGCRPDSLFQQLQVPLLVLRPQREANIESVQAQLQLVEAAGQQTYVADPGVHGSSMLVAERAGGDVSAHWAVVKRFLRNLSH